MISTNESRRRRIEAGVWIRAFLLVTIVAAFPGWANAQQGFSSVDQTVDRVVAAENREIATIRQYSPIIETYIQEMRPDKELGNVPSKDHYFLGLADLKKGVVERSLLDKPKGAMDKLNPAGALSHLTEYFSTQYEPEGFLQMVFIDQRGIDRSHYHFDFVRREFLGEVRCLVFDVTPLPSSGKFRFKGRIWANENDYTIVRFNGVYTPIASMDGFNLHFDSWRTNMKPGVWLPTYVFSQESGGKSGNGSPVRLRSQTRLWGYDLRGAVHESEFSELQVEAPGSIQDDAAASQDPSPVEAERQWQRRGEDNVLERLQRSGFVAPPGPVDKVLDTVVNNIEVTNNYEVEPEVRCRVLLTSTLESFTIGHTIVVSRGLLDVLPDEASLATMLAQEMGAILVTKRSTDPWGFNDLTNVSTTEIVSRFSFRASPQEIELANQKALELLKNSPYKDRLKAPGLFMKQLDAQQKALPALINSKFGNRVNLAQQLVNSAPPLQAANLDQISALPLGGRIKLDPWSDKIDMVKAKPVALESEREKMPFEVTPFMPFLTYYISPGAAAAQTADAPKPSVTTANTDPTRVPAAQPQD
ncbi:MAG: hypothetical protein WAK91_16250 [Candidatus Acidiferrales bacterium]|jgi:hypothetical protein